MSATMARQGNTTTKTTVDNGANLDAVIAATQTRRRTLVEGAATVLGVLPNQVIPLLRNVWTVSKGQESLTDSEMFAGISMIARYELDPIAREIYVTRSKDGRLMTVIGVDGWIKILDRTDHYDGMIQTFHETAEGVVDWIETAIYSTKRKHPAVYRAYMVEYLRVAGFTAGKLPVHMLGIFSLRHAARRFTPLSGFIVTEEEAVYLSGSTDAEAGRKKPTQLDDLTERLAEKEQPQKRPASVQEIPESGPDPSPVSNPATADEPPDDLPDSSYESDRSKYLAELKAADSITKARAVREKWFGENSIVEWSQEDAVWGMTAEMEREDELRAARGPRSRTDAHHATE